MFRRIALLLSIAAVGWYVISRLLRPKEVYVGDDDLWLDEPQGGFADRVSETASGAVAATRRAAQAPIDRIRSIVGDSNQESDVAAASDGDGQTAPSVAARIGDVKGNVNRDGEKIYHLPGDPAYQRTRAEEMFTSAEEAEAAGYRRAGQRHNR
jgi:hypothetical protein